MAVTITSLAAHVGTAPGEATELLTSCLAEADALVAKYNVRESWVTGATPGTSVRVPGVYVATDAPEVIVDRAVIEVAADLFHRRNAPNGIVNAQFAGFDGAPAAVRISRDPLAPAYPILRRWVTPW